MSERSRKEREERAFEALIVSQLRKDCDPDKVKPEDLPKLTEKEIGALEGLEPDLIEKLWNKSREPRLADGTDRVSERSEADYAHMNRAEGISEETAAELERQRKAILERIKKKRESRKDSGA